MSRSRKVAAVTITAPADLTIAAAAEQRDAMAAKVTDGSDHVLDLGSVEELDTAGVQILVALSREINRRGRLASVVCSDAVTEVFATIGLGADLEPIGAGGGPS